MSAYAFLLNFSMLRSLCNRDYSTVRCRATYHETRGRGQVVMGERRAVSARAIVEQIAEGTANNASVEAFEDLIIEGSLDLSGMRINHPMTFVRCDFEHDLKMRGAAVDAVLFSGCRLNGLDGEDLEVRTDVHLCEATAVTGAVVLDKARIGGNLSCNGAILHASSGTALSADEASIAGHLLMSNGFKASGAVSLRKARIGGMLYCAHGLFDNSGGVAIAADDLEVAGHVMLNHGFKARGIVSLQRANFHQLLYCVHGSFENPGGDAIRADGLKVGGRVSFSEWFCAK